MEIKFKEVPKEIYEAFTWWHDGKHNMLDSDIREEFKRRIFQNIDKIAGNENRHFQENYFNNFTLLWNFAENSHLSIDVIEEIWTTALDPVVAWEKANKQRIHKGSPYFYLGSSYIKNKNINKGFVSLHEAYKEDLRTFNEDHPDKSGEIPPTPAFATLTLNPTKYNYFRDWVIEIMDYLEDRYIKSYERNYSQKLNFIDLSCKFLSKTEFIDLIFLFTYVISRTYDVETSKYIFNKVNALSIWIASGIFNDIFKIIEELIININGDKNGYFSNQLNYLIDHSNLSNLKNIKKEDRFSKFEKSRKDNPNQTFEEILNKTYQFPKELNPNEMDINIMLALGIRNYVSHNIEPLDIFIDYKCEIFERLIHLLFAVIINFY